MLARRQARRTRGHTGGFSARQQRQRHPGLLVYTQRRRLQHWHLHLAAWVANHLRGPSIMGSPRAEMGKRKLARDAEAVESLNMRELFSLLQLKLGHHVMQPLTHFTLLCDNKRFYKKNFNTLPLLTTQNFIQWRCVLGSMLREHVPTLFGHLFETPPPPRCAHTDEILRVIIHSTSDTKGQYGVGWLLESAGPTASARELYDAVDRGLAEAVTLINRQFSQLTCHGHDVKSTIARFDVLLIRAHYFGAWWSEGMCAQALWKATAHCAAFRRTWDILRSLGHANNYEVVRRWLLDRQEMLDGSRKPVDTFEWGRQAHPHLHITREIGLLGPHERTRVRIVYPSSDEESDESA